ncbi:unnamed protein product [Coffea canephora]|uniref:Uncharacterized protein n=1 Tax=Coffea canephora TaxID=49390 RepID=A0A068UKU7_COFCA|nr:unnamed protein product [Coffea canephora]
MHWSLIFFKVSRTLFMQVFPWEIQTHNHGTNAVQGSCTVSSSEHGMRHDLTSYGRQICSQDSSPTTNCSQ